MRPPGKSQQPSFREVKLSARAISSKRRLQSSSSPLKVVIVIERIENQAGDAHPLDGEKAPVRTPWRDKRKNL